MPGHELQSSHHFWVHIPCNSEWETRAEQVSCAIQEWSTLDYQIIYEMSSLPDMAHDTGILLEFIFACETPIEQINTSMKQMGPKELDRLMEEAIEHEKPDHCCECSGCFHCCECKGCSANAPRSAS